MKIVAISDTHTYHDYIDLPEGDVLVHTGDFSFQGNREEYDRFVDWFAKQPHPYKVFIAGNHDRILEKEKLPVPDGVYYLQDTSLVIDGIVFYGSPWQPEFCNWAFNLPRGRPLAEKWGKIPEDTEVLLTHGPPHKILDHCPGGNVGCEDLLERVLKLPNLKYHVFGHIHESYGIEVFGTTTFVNASSCTGRYRPINNPIVLEIK